MNKTTYNTLSILSNLKAKNLTNTSNFIHSIVKLRKVLSYCSSPLQKSMGAHVGTTSNNLILHWLNLAK